MYTLRYKSAYDLSDYWEKVSSKSLQSAKRLAKKIFRDNYSFFSLLFQIYDQSGRFVAYSGYNKRCRMVWNTGNFGRVL